MTFCFFEWRILFLAASLFLLQFMKTCNSTVPTLSWLLFCLLVSWTSNLTRNCLSQQVSLGVSAVNFYLSVLQSQSMLHNRFVCFVPVFPCVLVLVLSQKPTDHAAVNLNSSVLLSLCFALITYFQHGRGCRLSAALLALHSSGNNLIDCLL